MHLKLEKRRISRSLSNLSEEINRETQKVRDLYVQAERTEEKIKRLQIKYSELYVDNSRYDDLLSTYDDEDYLVMNTKFVVGDQQRGSRSQDAVTKQYISKKRAREERDDEYFPANKEFEPEIRAPTAKRVRYFDIVKKEENEGYIPL
jgi:hypothetical protein